MKNRGRQTDETLLQFEFLQGIVTNLFVLRGMHIYSTFASARELEVHQKLWDASLLHPQHGCLCERISSLAPIGRRGTKQDVDKTLVRFDFFQAPFQGPPADCSSCAAGNPWHRWFRKSIGTHPEKA